MSKIVLGVLTFAAFLYAGWLVLFRRQLPDPKHATGLKRRFILATLLFVGLFGAGLANGGKKKADVMCYDIMPNIDQPITRQQLAGTLKAVWRTLDPSRAQEFREKLEKAAGDKVIRQRTADMLAIAFSEVAYHKKRTRGDGPKVSCYDITMLDGMLSTTRENVLKQLELLEGARKSGKIDEETCKKALTVLAREVQMLYLAKDPVIANNHTAQRKLSEEYRENKIIAGDSASVAAGIIVALEDGKVTDMTPGHRLSVMKERVEGLLTGVNKSDGSRGPAGNDWMDPAINPNVYAVLEKAGIISARRRVSCYERVGFPVSARSEELKKLQQELLDKNVKAGVLDVEVAEKAAAATDDSAIDYATEADIRDYQKKVRRVMRMLYKHGELPSSFVEKMERSVDVEIISFDLGKALRNDVRWHMRSLVWSYIGDEFVKILEQKKLIDPARNHRHMTDWSGEDHTESAKKRLAEFVRFLESKEELQLDGDKNITIKKYQLPQTDLEYRMRIRKVCRALSKTDLVDGGMLVDKNQLKAIEEVIGIPIIGVIEK